jgi:hypothetical protein
METLIGFAFGFIVGTREGRHGLSRIVESAEAIRESGSVKHLIGEGASAFAPLMRELARATGGSGG